MISHMLASLPMPTDENAKHVAREPSTSKPSVPCRKSTPAPAPTAPKDSTSALQNWFNIHKEYLTHTNTDLPRI